MSESYFILSIIPALFLSIVTILIVRWFLTSFNKQNKALTLKEERKQVLTLRFQAYERVALFLERISPESIIIREQQQGLTCMQFHSILVRSIRKEFEHNIAMQIYITDTAWEAIRNAREEMVKLINTCAAEVSPNNPSIELGQIILERSNSVTFHLNKAIGLIKKDISSFDH